MSTLHPPKRLKKLHWSPVRSIENTIWSWHSLSFSLFLFFCLSFSLFLSLFLSLSLYLSISLSLSKTLKMLIFEGLGAATRKVSTANHDWLSKFPHLQSRTSTISGTYSVRPPP